MVKQSAHRASATSLMAGAKTLKKVCNDTWKLAPKAPMFTRKTKTKDGKNKTVRTKRLIGTHAYKIMASGGAAYASSVLQREAKVFRKSIGSESKRSPWLPSITPGAIALLEQFLCAYAQEATRHAVSVRQGLGSGGKPLYARLNGKLMQLGYDQADRQIFGSTVPAPRHMHISNPQPKPKKDNKNGAEKKDDGDYQEPAPEADE